MNPQAVTQINPQPVYSIGSYRFHEQLVPSPSTQNQTQLLHQYIQCLQKQNHTKNLQRNTLYAELQRLEHSLYRLQQQLALNKSSPNTTQLISKIRDLQQQVTILKYEQQHLFQENLTMISNLEQTANTLLDVQRQNNELKSHKQELDKFKFALSKITFNLEQIQVQRLALAQTNLTLLQENCYLKNLIQAKIQREDRNSMKGDRENHNSIRGDREDHNSMKGDREDQNSMQGDREDQNNREQDEQELRKQQKTRMYVTMNEANFNREYQNTVPQITSVSNYLMSNSFQKISQYEEQYQESNGNSISVNQTPTSKYHSSQRNPQENEDQSVQEWQAQYNEYSQTLDNRNSSTQDNRNSHDKTVRSIRQLSQNSLDKDQQNQSSYLIFDERSGESFSLSFEVNQGQRPTNPQPNKSFSNEAIVSECLRERQVKLYQQDNKSPQGQYSSDKQQQQNYQQQSSNDVIQQMNDQSSHRLSVSKQSEKKVQTHKNLRQQPPCVQSLKQQIVSLREQVAKSLNCQKFLQTKIQEMQKAQSLNITQMQSKIEELLTNYESIVSYTQELEQDNVELYEKNEKLENQKQQMLERRKDIQQGIQQLLREKNQLIQSNNGLVEENAQLKVKLQHMEHYCSQAQEYINSVNSSQMQYHNLYGNSQNYMKFTAQINKFELIKQNNELIERLNQLQMQNCSLYNKISSQYSNQSSLNYLDEDNDKQNCYNSINYHFPSPNINQKFFRTPSHQHLNQNAQQDVKKYKYLNQNTSQNIKKNTSLSFRSQIQKHQQSVNKRRNSLKANNRQQSNKREQIESREGLKEKLEKRIESIKKENTTLLNELEYY